MDIDERKSAAAQMMRSYGLEEDECYSEHDIIIDDWDECDYFRHGLTKFESGDYASAINGFTGSVIINPDYAIAYLWRGAAKLRLKDHRGAKEDYNRVSKYGFGDNICHLDRVIELDTNNAEAYYLRGDVKGYDGDYAGAIDDYTQAIALKPDYIEAYHWRGHAKLEMENYRGAITDYTKAMDLDDSGAMLKSLYSARGDAKLEDDDYEGAIDDYDRVIALDPKNAWAYYDRGFAKFELEDWYGAIDDFDRAIELELDEAVAYKNRGNAKSELKDWRGAIADYDCAIELDSKDAHIYLRRGDAKFFLNDWPGAIGDYGRAIELRPDYADGDYIYRGEPKCYEKVSSSLYRRYEKDKDIPVDGLNIEGVQEALLEETSGYTSQRDIDEILAELQHYGGKTNLIDFTTDCLIALFFACDGAFGEDGRVILLRKSNDENMRIWRPHNPGNRVIAQKSIFVQPTKGFVESTKTKIIKITKSLKKPILDYLRRHHGIHTETVYNDLHGFIRNQGLHQECLKEMAIGTIHQQQGNYDKAIECFNKAIKLRPNYVYAYNNRGLAYMDRKKFERAIQDYDKAIELKPDYAKAHNNRGLTYYCIDKFNLAITDLDKAIDLKPDYAIAYHNRGLAYMDRENEGDLEQAIRDYDKAIELKPDDAMAYYNRGNAYTKKGDLDRAIRSYDRAIELKPDYPDAHNNRGAAYAEKGDLDRAFRDFTKAMELNPRLAEPYYSRSFVWLRRREWDKTRADLRAAEERGADIARIFSDEFGSIPDFEQKYQVRLPDDIREMLTPGSH